MIIKRKLFISRQKRKFNGGFNRQNLVLNPFLQFRYQIVKPEITVNLFAVDTVLLCNRIDNSLFAELLHQFKLFRIRTGIDDRGILIVPVCIGGDQNISCCGFVCFFDITGNFRLADLLTSPESVPTGEDIVSVTVLYNDDRFDDTDILYTVRNLVNLTVVDRKGLIVNFVKL